MPEGNVQINLNGQTVEVSKTDYTKAIEVGKLEIKNENLLVYTKEEEATRLKNLEKTHYGTGKIAALEMKAKDLKEKYPELADIEGKDLDTLFEKYAEKKVAAAKVPVNEQVEKYKKDIETLRGNLLNVEKEKTTLEQTYQGKEKQLQVNNHYLNIVPEKAISETMQRGDIIALFRARGYDVIKEGEKFVATKDGEIQKHPVTLEPLDTKAVMLQFVTDMKLLTNDGGRGGVDDTGGKGDTLEAFTKEMEDKGIHQGSAKFNEEMQTRINNKTLKI